MKYQYGGNKSGENVKIALKFQQLNLCGIIKTTSLCKMHKLQLGWLLVKP